MASRNLHAFPPRVGQSASSDPYFSEEKAALRQILTSRTFLRSPRLARLLEYLCHKYFHGEAGQLKEYTIGVELFGRTEDFQPRDDASVRVDVNRLRRQLLKYYKSEGKFSTIIVSIPAGQYAPSFVRSQDREAQEIKERLESSQLLRKKSQLAFLLSVKTPLITATFVLALATAAFLLGLIPGVNRSAESSTLPVYPVPPQVDSEVRIIAGAQPGEIADQMGRVWWGDRYFGGGKPVQLPTTALTAGSPEWHSAREGDFTYHIPLQPGVYEVRLYFMETAAKNQGQTEQARADENRGFHVFLNFKPILVDFDIETDAGGRQIPDIRVFKDVQPTDDGIVHLMFKSGKGPAKLNALEILPTVKGKIRPLRIACRSIPYKAANGILWHPDDIYASGGRLAARPNMVSNTVDPALFSEGRQGHFRYTIPVASGRYTLRLRFSGYDPERKGIAQKAPDASVFSVFSNGETLLRNFNPLDEAGAADLAIDRVFQGIEPNAQGKIVLDFIPTQGSACLNALEVLSE